MDRRGNGGRVINVFETWCWRKMLKVNWTDRITNFFKGKKKKDYF
jgi:hypothetical protein